MKRSGIKAGILAAVIGVGVLGATVLAQTTAPATGESTNRALRGPLAGMKGRMKALQADLGLTPEQKAAARAIFAAHKQEILAAAHNLVLKRRALHEAASANPPDDHAIRAAAADLGQAAGDAAVLASKIRVELKAKVNLTDQQIDRLKAFRAENRAAVDEFFKERQAKP
jgi:Spy/CpxP family protein refolding chaperone